MGGGRSRGQCAAMEAPNPALTWIGTATVLIRYAGMTVLTDPNFLHRGERAWLGHGLTSKRLTEPALHPEDLPPLDAIVLSHLHGDHWDRRARRELDHGTPVITTTHAAKRLPRHGFAHTTGLEHWQQTTVSAHGVTLTVTSTPGAHALGPLAKVLPPVMGSILDFTADGHRPLRLWLSGDTLVIPALTEIGRRHPDLDLGVLHLGGTRIFGALVTMDAEQGVQALRMVRPRRAVPVHHDDYPVFTSPLADFRAAVNRADGLTTDVVYLQPGGTLDL